MISANMARFESKHRSEVNEILDNCEKRIDQACKNGKFSCRVDIWIGDTAEEVYEEVDEEVQRELGELGYETHLTNDREWSRNAPCDQAAYYETLTISWEEEKK